MQPVDVKGRGDPYGQWEFRDGFLKVRLDDNENHEMWYEVRIPAEAMRLALVPPGDNSALIVETVKVVAAVNSYIEDCLPDGWIRSLVATYDFLRANATDVDPDATEEMLASVKRLDQAIRKYARAREEHHGR